MPVNHTDIFSNNWVDRQLPPWLQPWARLIRIDRPIGTWLLLLPCWWGVAVAGGAVPNLWLMFLFAVGAVIMRGAGCIVNDIYDRDLDRQVERTQPRPLASGQIGLWPAVAFLAVLLMLGLGVLVMFNRLTFWLGVASLALVFTYPLAKRVTWWPQLVLGLAFNWGALMGMSAVRGTLGATAFFLYAAGVFWTLGYDTIYAQQDVRDDARIGVKSLALKLADKVQTGVAGFYAMAFFALGLAGMAARLGWGFYAVMLLAAVHAGKLVLGWKPEDPADCLKRFQANRDFGLIVLAAIVAGRWL